MEAARSLLTRVIEAKCDLPFFKRMEAQEDRLKTFIQYLQDASLGESFQLAKEKPLSCAVADDGSYNLLTKIENGFHGVCDLHACAATLSFIHA